MNWLLDDSWFEHLVPWHFPPPPQLVYSNNNSPVNSFLDYMYPVIDRLVRFDFLLYSSIDFHSRKHLPVIIYWIIIILIPIEHREFKMH
jgi:hypothetical protein